MYITDAEYTEVHEILHFSLCHFEGRISEQENDECTQVSCHEPRTVDGTCFLKTRHEVELLLQEQQTNFEMVAVIVTLMCLQLCCLFRLKQLTVMRNR